MVYGCIDKQCRRKFISGASILLLCHGNCSFASVKNEQISSSNVIYERGPYENEKKNSYAKIFHFYCFSICTYIDVKMYRNESEMKINIAFQCDTQTDVYYSDYCDTGVD